MKYLVLYSHPRSGWSMVKFSLMVNTALKNEFGFYHLSPYSALSARLSNHHLKAILVFLERKLIFPIQILIAVLKNRPNRLFICDQSDAHLRFLVPFIDAVIYCHDLFAVNAMLKKDTFSKQSLRIRIELRFNLFFLKRGLRYISVSNATRNSILNLISDAEVSVIPPTVLKVDSLIYLRKMELPFCLLPMNDHWRKDRLGGIKVFCKLSAQMGQKLNLIIVGNSLTDSEINYLIQMDKLDSVEVLHHISETEIQSLYRNCEFVIFTSRLEGFGLPIIEANSYSRLAIYSNIETLCEVGQKINYCLARGIESTDWIDAIKFLKNERNRETALKYFEDNFAFELFKQRLMRELAN